MLKGCLFCLHGRSGWPKVMWFVTESKHLSKPPRDWFPHIKEANQDTAYIEVTQTMTETQMHVLIRASKHFHPCCFSGEINAATCPPA